MDSSSIRGVGGGTTIIGQGRDQLAEALEDSLGLAGKPVYLMWTVEAGELCVKRSGVSETAPRGWEVRNFMHGPGGFASRAMDWLRNQHVECWKLYLPGDKPDQVRITPL